MIPSEQFRTAGWLRLPGRIEPDLLTAVIDSIGSMHPSNVSTPERIMDAWRSSRPVRELAVHPMILDALATLFDRRPIPFQTLNFDRGTGQPLHADSIHFDSIPHGLMCGVWVALEAIGPDQGPVRYVPGSHRLPPVQPHEVLDRSGRFNHHDYEELVATRVSGLPVEEFCAEAGEVLVWHADLAHGGAPVISPDSTRRSQVTHYFFEGGAYFTPLMSDLPASEYYVREPLVDIATGRRVIHQFEGRPARFVHLSNGRSLFVGADEPPPPLLQRMVSGARAARRRAGWHLAPWVARRRAASRLSRR